MVRFGTILVLITFHKHCREEQPCLDLTVFKPWCYLTKGRTHACCPPLDRWRWCNRGLCLHNLPNKARASTPRGSPMILHLWKWSSCWVWQGHTESKNSANESAPSLERWYFDVAHAKVTLHHQEKFSFTQTKFPGTLREALKVSFGHPAFLG